MLLNKLLLKNFRNYQYAEFEFSPSVNILIGGNGAGKSSVLEAVYLLVSGRSFRTKSDAELCKKGDNMYYVSGAFYSEYDKMSSLVELSFHNGTKRAAVDKKEMRKRKDLIGRYLTVLLLPSDTGLIDGAPAVRRDFFNMFISNVESGYLDKLISYNHALKSRNLMLKVGSQDYKIYDEQLAENATFIINRCAKYSQLLVEHMNAVYEEIFSKSGYYSLVYDDASAAVVDKDGFLEMLKRNESRHVRLKTTANGPHRSGYKLSFNGLEARQYASLGEKRMAAVLMKLAEDGITSKLRNEKPVMMIDDALLELDKDRRARLLEYMNGKGQIFITVTEPEKVSAFNGAKIIDVSTQSNFGRKK